MLTATTDPALRRNAGDLRALLAAEDGIAAAVDAIDAVLDDHST